MKMAKYKIIYDRKNCIGVQSCAILAQDFWKMNKVDDKADLIGGKQKGEDIWELEIDEADLERNKAAAKNCPVEIIKIIDESGKEIPL